jgi:PAS domain S-box-containing protein
VEEELQRNHDAQTVINSLLRLSLEDIPLEELLMRTLDLLLSVPWLAVESEGSIFLVEDGPEVLVMKVQKELEEVLQETCAQISFGRCLCGQAALRQEIQFADRLEDRHEIRFEGMTPHGHYCVPILSAGRALGVINLYLREGHLYDQREEEFLTAVANTLAGIVMRSQAEESLRKSQASLAEAQRVAHVGNWDWDIMNNGLRWSDEIYRIFGLAPQEFGATYEAFLNSVHPHDREFVEEAVNKALYQNKPYSIDHRIVLPGGSERIVHEQAEVFLDETGRAIRMLGTVQDITERVRAEEALKTSEERYRGLFDGLPVGLYRTTSEGQILDANPALVNMLGYPDRESLLAVNSASIYVAPEDRERWQALMDREGIVRDAEVQVRRYDGTVIWVRDTARAIRNAEPPVVYYEGAVEDITARKQAQAALIEAEKLAMAGKLAASLAHEISNPLQTVIGCLGLAEETLAAGGDVSRYLHVAHEELRRTADIVAQLRDLHRPSRPEDKEPTDVNDLLEQVLDLSRKQCESQGIEVSRAMADVPVLPLVADQIKQVFLNLLLNAMEAMPQGGRLEVSTAYTSQPAGVRIAFTDSGEGIVAHVLPHVFEPFYSTRPEGLGLGLFISRNIVKQHGGQIEVDSRVGEGTTFTVWLPA